jgi:hypothetical protein
VLSVLDSDFGVGINSTNAFICGSVPCGGSPNRSVYRLHAVCIAEANPSFVVGSVLATKA